MAVTRLKRKGRRNKSRAHNRVDAIKRHNLSPVIKNVDVEEIKNSFEATPEAKPAKKTKKKEEPVAEVKVEESTESTETSAE